MTQAISEQVDALFSTVAAGIETPRVMRVTLPYPPSVNHYWRHCRGISFLSAEAKRYKRDASLIAMAAGLRCATGDVSLAIAVYRPRKSGDLDNILKALLDSLRGIAYEDDKQIIHIDARRFDDKRNPRAEVSIEPLNAVGAQQLLVDHLQAGGKTK